MIFTGDIALPYVNCIDYSEIPASLRNKSWVGNLEGSLITDINIYKYHDLVYNHFDAIQAIKIDFNWVGFLLANNHILDVADYSTINNNIKKIGIQTTGLGSTLKDSLIPLILKEDGNTIIIINHGWKVIQCKTATNTKPGIAPLKKELIINNYKNIRNEHPNAKILAFFHWCYELEGEPQPFERELAFHLIDLGIDGIFGSHPHRVGGFEYYKGKPIIYSLGNWLFMQGHYFNKKLNFPSFCDLQVAVEWKFVTDEIILHWFSYDKNNNKLKYKLSEPLISSKMAKQHTPFLDMNNSLYSNWYRKNHYHKNKLLPIYNYNDSLLIVFLKNLWNGVRDKLILIIKQIIILFRHINNNI